MKLSLFILFSIFMSNLNAQDLSSHQWKERLVLILTTDLSNADYLKQLEELKADGKALEERKLVIYKITPTQFKVGLDEEGKWKQGDDLYSKYKTTNSDVEVKLIGLDGGVKLDEKEFVSREKLFSVIDAMPMRRNEIRKNNE